MSDTPKTTGPAGAGAILIDSERMANVFRHAAIGMAFVAPDGRFLDVNASFCRMLGYDAAELLTTTYPEITHRDDLEISMRRVRELLDGSTDTFHMEKRYLHRSGAAVWALLSVALVRDQGGAPLYFIAQIQDITERKQAETALRESNEFVRSLLRAIPVAVFFKDRQGRYIGCNDVFTQITGASAEAIKGKTVHELWPSELSQEYHLQDLAILESCQHQVYEFTVRDKHGVVRPVIFAKDVFRDADGKPAGIVGAFIDITEQKQATREREHLQAQFIHAQKMESVGRLAGGVAHDFNNMLGVILGHTEIILSRPSVDAALAADLHEIQRAAERSADLTRQLLAFARKQTVAPRVIDLNERVGAMLTMIRRLIGEDIRLEWRPSAEAVTVKIDPSQLDQILANLCVNARDAITGTGNVTIETARTTLTATECADQADAATGIYVLLAVTDDGCGMNADTIGHLFEPFFTTKETGKGTGLGLATVYGVVRQNGGFIRVNSEPNRGTTFKIYLPAHTAECVRTPEPACPQPTTGTTTILLVEDEASLLGLTTKMLERLGYTVIAAATPREAIRLAGARTTPIDLLMTDVVMPEMNGRDLAQHLLQSFPQMKRLFMSGYTANVIAHHGVLDQGVHFLQKPFLMKELEAKLHEVLRTS